MKKEMMQLADESTSRKPLMNPDSKLSTPNPTAILLQNIAQYAAKQTIFIRPLQTSVQKGCNCLLEQNHAAKARQEIFDCVELSLH